MAPNISNLIRAMSPKVNRRLSEESEPPKARNHQADLLRWRLKARGRCRNRPKDQSQHSPEDNNHAF